MVAEAATMQAALDSAETTAARAAADIESHRQAEKNLALRVGVWEGKVEALGHALEDERLERRELERAARGHNEELGAARDKHAMLDGEVRHYRGRHAQAMERLTEGQIRFTRLVRRATSNAKSGSVARGSTAGGPKAQHPPRASGSNGAEARGGPSAAPEDDARSSYTEESYYERAYPAAPDKDGSKDASAEDGSSASRKGADDGFGALTDEEYVKVMSAIGIIPDFGEYSEAHLDSVLSKEAARARIDGWFGESPDRVQMGAERRERVTRRMTAAYEKRIAAKDRASVEKLLKEQTLPPPAAKKSKSRSKKKEESASTQRKGGSPPKSKKHTSPYGSVDDPKKSSVKERTASPESTFEK